jgi:Xaa-Pro aminopeptidase
MRFVQKRLDNFRSVLRAKGLDAIVLASYRGFGPHDGSYNFYYLTNILRRFSTYFLVLTEDAYGVWVEQGDLERAERLSWLKPLSVMEPPERGNLMPWEFGGSIRKHVKEMLKSGGRRSLAIKVGIDGRYLQGSVVPSIRGGGVEVVDVAEDLELSRLVKDAREIKALKHAARVVDIGVSTVMSEIRPGMTEVELAAISEEAMRREGAECFWWKTLINSGPDANRWAECPRNRRMREGDMIGIDFTPVCDGYAADIGRSFVLGKPSRRQLQVLELTKRSLDDSVASLKDGVTMREVVEASIRSVKGTEYERYFTGPGHCIGLYSDTFPGFFFSVSKIPKLKKAYLDRRFSKGTTVAMEIVMTVPGVGRVCIEDDYLIEANGAERLTRAPIVFGTQPG